MTKPVPLIWNGSTSIKNILETVVLRPKQQITDTLLQNVSPINVPESSKPTNIANSYPSAWIQTINLNGLPTLIQTQFSPAMSLQKTVLLEVVPDIYPQSYVVSPEKAHPKSYENVSNAARLQMGKASTNPSSVSSFNVNSTFVPPNKTPHLPSVFNKNFDFKSSSNTSGKAPKRTYNIVKGENSRQKMKVNKKEKPVDPSFCFVCNVTCGSVELLQLHKEGIEGQLFHCRVCAQQFNYHSELESHSTNHKIITCKGCQERCYTQKDLLHHKKTNKECRNLVECGICNKWLTKKRLTLHKRTIHAAKRISNEVFKCDICLATYDTVKKLSFHLENVHNAYEDIECQICKKISRGPKKLKYHIQTYHDTSAEENKIFSCEICKKTFNRVETLRSHVKIHDEAERLCEICGKSIKERLMKNHMKIEHPITGIFICKYCNEKFDTFHKMKKHIKTHSAPPKPVYCDICGKKYVNEGTLRSHYLIHSEDKPFKCGICSASFKQKTALNTHQRVHSDIGKYFCSGCGMSFKWQQTYKKHIQKCNQTQEDVVDDNLSGN